jgi:hypothetical protein
MLSTLLSLGSGPGHVLHHLSGILVEHGIMLRDQEAVVVLPQNSHELEEGVGAAHLQIGELRFSRLRMRE